MAYLATGLQGCCTQACEELQILAMAERERMNETGMRKVMDGPILNQEQKSIAMNPYRRKLPEVNIQARLESEELSSNASLSASVRGQRRGEKEG